MAGRLRLAFGLIFVLSAVAVTAVLAAPDAESHSGHTQKKLFEGRWHYEPGGDYESWMNLTTSDLWINCAAPIPCHTRWIGNFTDSIDDWNGQPTTVDFDWTDGVYNEFFDINVVIEDNLGDPGLLGIGPSFDEDGFLCIGPCEVWYGVVWLSDESHGGPYGTYNSRTGTTTHELGHLLQLRHESVNADESVLYNCGFDDTGPIPHSVMAYDCIDPVVFGGEGEYLVQPFDACGVNHASFDPSFGYAGCELTATETPSPSPEPSDTPSPTVTPSPTPSATPTPSPTPEQSPPQGPTDTPSPTPGEQWLWGDLNCNGETDPGDTIASLRHFAGLTSLHADCPFPDDMVEIGFQVAWGDVDCSGTSDVFDALKLQLAHSGSPKLQPEGCPEIGEQVDVIVG